MPTNHHNTGWGTGTVASLGRRISGETARHFQQIFKINAAWCIDTADSYGSGDAERLIGRILPDHLTTHTLITKAGYVYSNLSPFWGPTNQVLKKLKCKVSGRQCFDPSYLETSVNRSLARIRKPSICTFLLHDPPVSAVEDRKVWHILRKLREHGLIKKFGLSSSNPDIITAAMAAERFDVVQTPANLLVASSFRNIWLKCYRRGIQIIGNHLFPSALVNRAGLSHSVLARASAAILPPSSTLLCGTHNPSHLQEFSHWINDPFTSEQLAQCFKQAGLSAGEFIYD